MNLIASADNNWAIGYQGQLLASIRADLQNFKKITMGKTVVLGRKTLETFPSGRPLPGRRNIILTRDRTCKIPDAETVNSVEDLMNLLKDVDTNDIFIIGGSSVYAQMLPYCDVAYITRIDYTFQADSFIPNLDKDPDWELVEESDEQTCYDLVYYFRKYVRKSKV